MVREAFDLDFYLSNYPDIADAEGVDPVEHYCVYGWKEHRDPTPDFSTGYYLETNPDVRDAGINPFYHYLSSGKDQGRRAVAPAAPEADDTAVSHEILLVREAFDLDFYLSNYPDIADAEGVDPVEHYCVYGWKERRDPTPDFSTGYYLETNPDVRDAGINPFYHYLSSGKDQGWRAVAPAAPEADDTALKGYARALEAFDIEYYALVNPQLADLSGKKLEEHFAKYGYSEGLLYAPPSKAKISLSVQSPANEAKKQKPCGGRAQYSSPLVISGFHRSGTSLTANLFHEAGLFLGKELLGAKSSNPFGHFEAVDVVKFHDRLLDASGTYWQTDTDFIPIMNDNDWKWMYNFGVRNSFNPAWGFKDPRNCLFLPQWASLFPDMRVLYVFRPAVECVHSIKRRAIRDLVRDNVSHINRRFWLIDDLAVRMYLIYASAFLRFAETFAGDLCVVELNDILDGRDLVSEVREHWGYQLSDAYIGDIYDSSVMTRAGPNETVKDLRLLEQLEDVEEKLRSMARRGFTNTNNQTPLVKASM
ncbi:hypothetical protein PXK15_21425 [Phaeobacter gallaeciensis]|nr:hypothetical protein [Phaeobacter gallaeciensis]MDE4172472.1 hypothetical protein [Phaeobacter gallaeciensis]MDE4180993.1 hypothetical protein [Phaeobacter gallaeciensis]MDE4197686.1 hypothetical protein [Phaeobacter gallaeciensis]